MITFADWEKVLKAGVPPERYHAYREDIAKFRYWLREIDNVPNIDAFKQHLEWKQSYLAPGRFAISQEPLHRNQKSPYELVAGLAASDDA